MSWLRTTSGKVVVLLSLVFAFGTFEKIEAINTGSKPCLTAYDGYGYYMYLPHFFETGHLKMDKEWAQKLQNEYCFGTYVYQFEQKDLKHEIDIYHMGLSFLMLPSYSIAEIWARIGGYPTDGFSYPYHILYILNALLFIFLGLLYLRKLLRLFANELSTAITLILIAFGTNTYFIFNFQYDLPHLYLFTVNAAIFYHTLRYVREERLRNIWFAAFLFGLAVCIRPTQLILGLIPFLFLLQKHGKSLLFLQRISLFGAAVLICNIPQFLYWKLIGGDWIILNLHTEDIVLSDPNLWDFLFSYRKGWLLYSPLFLLLPIGWWLMYRKNRVLFWATAIFSFLYIYVMSSWECWWYASSFGQRVMVDIYPILAIPLIFFVNAVRKPTMIAITGTFAVGCMVLNFFQSEQVRLGILDGHRMTKEHYWHIFGEFNPEEVHHRFLLIDRGDLLWPQKLSQFDDNPFQIKKRTVYSYPDTIIIPPGSSASIQRIHLYDHFETDETLVEIPMVFRTTDSTQASVLRMECVSDYNCYSWDNMDLSFGRRQNIDIYDTLRFNLPNIRHIEDSMQMYILNPNNTTVTLKEFKIVATSLIR